MSGYFACANVVWTDLAMDWHELATTSQYQTAIAIRQELSKGNLKGALAGIDELVDALGRSDRREVRSQVIRLMAHIITWKTPPGQQRRSWAVPIEHARIEIEELLELEPSLRPCVPDLLQELFSKARRVAEKDMGTKTPLEALSRGEVFDDEYTA